jgi:hypothetical protein
MKRWKGSRGKKLVTTLTSLTQVATKGKDLKARRENKQVGKA